MSNKRIDQNGPIALAFHVLLTVFILAPLVVVVVASFSDKDFISMPFDGASLRLRALHRH